MTTFHNNDLLNETLKEPPFLITITIIIIVVIITLKHIINKARSSTKQNLPPSPRKLPIIGNLHQLVGPNPHISLLNLSRKYGPVIFLQLGQVPTVILSSAKVAKEAFKASDLALSNRPQIFSAKHLFYNCTNIVFSPYGAYWRYVRKVSILELFSAKRVQSFSFIRAEEVHRLVRRISDRRGREGTTDLSKMLGLFANDVLCRAVFGRDFSGGGEFERDGFQKMLDEYQELLGGLSVGDYFPSMEFVHTLTGMKARLVNTFNRFDRLFDQIVEEHLDPEKEKDYKDLVDVLLEIRKDGNGEMPLTLDNIKAIILDMFAAGTDTTFIVLDWTMTELILNPSVLEKAQAEVRTVMGERSVVSETDLPQLSYMKAVIKESLRYHPPVPVLVPRETMDHVTIDGFDIPAKTRIFVNAWAIGRDPESWEDPGKFKPERFLGSSVDYKGQDFELIPFGAGRRICPAMNFGMASVELALAQLLHSFDWELPAGVRAEDLDMSEVFGISMHRKESLVVVANPHRGF